MHISMTVPIAIAAIILWQLGVATNQQIVAKFGLTYSSVSQPVRAIKENFNKNKELARKYHHIKSLMKI